MVNAGVELLAQEGATYRDARRRGARRSHRRWRRVQQPAVPVIG
jgi:hypothetical protein